MKQITPATTISWILAAIGLFGTGIGIYTYVFPQKPDITYEITSDNNLLNADGDVSNLSVIYGGEDIRNSNSNIKILSLKVSNRGTAGILINHYDQNDLLGVSVENGRVIETPTIMYASNNYLKDSLSVSLVSPTEFRFPTVIIEPQDFFIIRAVVIYDKSKQPRILSLGKVAGIKNIKVLEPVQDTEIPFFKKALFGSALIQLVRLLAYTVAGLFTVLIVMVTLEFISTTRTKSERKKLVTEFSSGREHSKTNEILYHRYVTDGLPTLNTMRALLGEPDRLNRKYKEIMQSSKTTSVDYEFPYFSGGSRRAIKLMCEDGLISEDSVGNIKVNGSMNDTLIALTRFLIKKDPSSSKSKAKSTIISG